MTLADLQRAAAAAIADHEKLGKRIDEFFLGDPTFTPARRAALLGPFPSWAHYVLSLGEPAGAVVTAAQLSASLGSVKNWRAWALECFRLLTIHLKRAPSMPEFSIYTKRAVNPCYTALRRIAEKGHLDRRGKGKARKFVFPAIERPEPTRVPGSGVAVKR